MSYPTTNSFPPCSSTSKPPQVVNASTNDPERDEAVAAHRSLLAVVLPSDHGEKQRKGVGADDSLFTRTRTSLHSSAGGEDGKQCDGGLAQESVRAAIPSAYFSGHEPFRTNLLLHRPLSHLFRDSAWQDEALSETHPLSLLVPPSKKEFCKTIVLSSPHLT